LTGIHIPHLGHLANADDIRSIACHGETLGFRYALIADHIVVPRKIESAYPYAQSGAFAQALAGKGDSIAVAAASRDSECLDQLSVMAFLAAPTSEIRLLSSVMVVPHRNAVVTAKALATIDVLSHGRVTVGCGAGGLREEFEAIGAPPFALRGAVTDEYAKGAPSSGLGLATAPKSSRPWACQWPSGCRGWKKASVQSVGCGAKKASHSKVSIFRSTRRV
jgi:alkanesulfonate monooxygenase SsuD/methylene tetrahydromethanopterin reductase-like flavin-dependent oxidoreductase (luciferase family)